MVDDPRQDTLTDLTRLDRLRSYDILDTAREPVFDRFAFIVAQAFRAPIAMLNLIDADRQWSKAFTGSIPQQVPIALSFCARTVASGTPVIVEDATRDDRFRHNPLVTGPPHVRFYAGVPLIAYDGSRIGALCAFDHTPRTPLPKQIWNMVQLAREVMDIIEARRFTSGA